MNSAKVRFDDNVLEIQRQWESLERESSQHDVANDLQRQLFGDESNARQIGEMIQAFLTSSSLHRTDKTTACWLALEFRKYPNIWESEEELKNTVQEVLESISEHNETKASLQTHLDQGNSQSNWLAGKLEQAAAASGAESVGAYASQIDTAINLANERNWAVITRQDGNISQAINLDGFIAEQHHVNTFNIDAATQGSKYRARVLEPESGQPFGKNSLDIGIYDENGKLVRRYQSKYGADSQASSDLFEKGDYRGQRKLVPKGHADQKSSDRIEIDGVKSEPLSKEDAKALQRKAQEAAEAKQYDWKDANRIEIAKQIGKQALLGACISVGLQGARILGRRVWNTLTGKSNQSADEDLKEFFKSSLKSTKQVSVQVAVSGALVVAAKSGLLGKMWKNTPAGRIVPIAAIALENAKVLFKLGSGEISNQQALDAMGRTTITTVVAIAATTKGTTLGASIGLALGPAGAAFGGFVGGLVGGVAGSTVGDTIYEAGKSLCKTAVNVLVDTVSSVGKGISHVGRTLNRAWNWLLE